MVQAIKQCRLCGNTNLVDILDLGMQALTGVFPKRKADRVTSGPLVLVRCSDGANACGLVQLKHTYDLNEMYGENYGYRSGLNTAMVKHLRAKVTKIQSTVPLKPNDLIIDIGSNDSTTLQAYPPNIYRLVGVDPTGVKFKAFYPPHIALLPEFFSAKSIRQHSNEKAKVITSFSMFYDLEDPLAFMRDVFDVLDDEGIWVFEQSYMPAMLRTNSFDTVCHEHLEYYSLRQIKWAADKVGFKIIDVEFNDVNGGSFSISVAKAGSSYSGNDSKVSAILREEESAGLSTAKPYQDFRLRIERARADLRGFIADAKRTGKSIMGLGASTKGNVLLQFCGLTQEDIPFVGEVNSDKFGCFTPGTLIPIIPEKEMLAKAPDYILVLPWHFRSFFEHKPSLVGVDLLFPLPKMEVVRVA